MQYFNTVFGRNLMAEVPCFAPDPFLIVTMEDLWPHIQEFFPDDCSVYFVHSMEEAVLLEDLNTLGKTNAFIGVGGGQAIDAAKYFSWRTRKILFQFPTSLSVDAVFGHRSGVRHGGNVRYVGWAVPDTVFVDYDVIKSAPPVFNHAGIGDVLCFFTGVLDWQYADERGRCEDKWPYDPRLADISMQRVENLLKHQDDVRDLNDDGIRVLIEGHKWGGTSFLGAGWNPRHVEGFDHFFFYALEFRTRRKFLHGQPVCLGTYIGALLHDARPDEILSAIHNIGVDMRPEAMDVTWDDVAGTLYGLGDYVRKNNLWYGIAHEAAFDSQFVSALREKIENRYGSWE